MNPLALARLLKAAPFAMSAFGIVLMLHGMHGFLQNGDPGGTGGPNFHWIRFGDPGGTGGPNFHWFRFGDPGGTGGPN